MIQTSAYPNNRITQGDSLAVTYKYQDRDSGVRIEWFMDSDTNSFNTAGGPIAVQTLDSTGDQVADGTVSLSTFGVGTGIRHLLAKITSLNDNSVRYDYCDTALTIVSASIAISGVSPRTLNAMPANQRQWITISGTGFTSASTLLFNDGAPYPSNPNYLDYRSTTEIRYNLAVGLNATNWTVKVMNGAVESNPYTFYVVSGGTQLTGLSIFGPATVDQNNQALYAATAIFSDGSTSSVTPAWSLNAGAPASISTAGQLSASSVSANTSVTVTATYVSGTITKTANFNVTIVKTGTGSGYEQRQLVVNEDFANGSAGWTLTGAFQADSRFSMCRSCPGYAYLANADGSTGNNLNGTLNQTFTIPANAVEAALDYWHRTTTQETGGNYDRLNLHLRLPGGSLEGLDDIWNTAANTAYTKRSIDLIAYKGQTVTLEFTGTTDANQPTTFRVDDISVLVTVPITPTPVLLGIRGPTSLQETTTAQYDVIVVYSDGSVKPVTPNWSISGPATISASGLLSAGTVSSDTTATIDVTYTEGITTLTLNYPVTIVNVAPEFSYLAISGPNSINENSSGQFTATAIFSDGSWQTVSPIWLEDSSATTISGSGLLTAGEVASDTVVIVSASHTIGGVTRNASQVVTLANIPLPPMLTSLVISGPSTVDENSTAQYAATTIFSDGSSQTVNPTWTEDSTATTISIFGLLSAGEVSADTPLTVSASYTYAGITCTASKSLTVVNITGTNYTLIVNASNGAVTKHPDQTSYVSGSQVVLTAMPTSGYQFSFWSDDASGSVNPLTVTMSSNLNITANFVVIPSQLPKQLTGVNLSNGVFRFLLNGPVGSDYVIHASSNLMNWLPISTNTIPVGGSMVVSDPQLPAQRVRFYRPLPTSPSFLGFDVRDLGTSGEESGAEAVNDLGQVAGWRSPDGIPRAFLWSGGVRTNLSENYSVAADINISGKIVGQASVNPNDRNLDRPVLWANGISSVVYDHQSRLGGINDSGWMVGRTDTRPFQALLFTNGSAMVLPAPSTNHSCANKINNRNMIVGWSGGPNGGDCFVWTNLAIDPQMIASNGECLGVNDQGEVVGMSDGRAFRWKDGKLELLEAGGATSINNAGWIVGWRTLNSQERAFLWRDDNLNGIVDASEVRDLNDFLSFGSGWVLSRANDVNNSGTIVGIGQLNGQTRAFALFPQN